VVVLREAVDGPVEVAQHRERHGARCMASGVLERAPGRSRDGEDRRGA
jgi:hypothetical protein